MTMDEYNKARAIVKPLHTKVIEEPTENNVIDLLLAFAINGLVISPCEGSDIPTPICGFISLPNVSMTTMVSHYIYPADQHPQ